MSGSDGPGFGPRRGLGFGPSIWEGGFESSWLGRLGVWQWVMRRRPRYGRVDQCWWVERLSCRWMIARDDGGDGFGGGGTWGLIVSFLKKKVF